MTQLAKINERQISPYQAYADETLAAAIAGDLLVFKKGQWFRGEGQTQVPPEARFVCNMEEVWTGWIRWFNGKPVEHRISRLIDFAPKLSREELGHTDKSLWETDPAGNPRDPWSATERLVLREVGQGGELLTFTTSSVGGRHALAKLCAAFNRGYRKHEGRWPVVKLHAETYTHSLFGNISKPVFKIVGWDLWDEEIMPDAANAPDMASELDDEIPF